MLWTQENTKFELCIVQSDTNNFIDIANDRDQGNSLSKTILAVEANDSGTGLEGINAQGFFPHSENYSHNDFLLEALRSDSEPAMGSEDAYPIQDSPRRSGSFQRLGSIATPQGPCKCSSKAG